MDGEQGLRRVKWNKRKEAGDNRVKGENIASKWICAIYFLQHSISFMPVTSMWLLGMML